MDGNVRCGRGNEGNDSTELLCANAEQWSRVPATAAASKNLEQPFHEFSKCLFRVRVTTYERRFGCKCGERGSVHWIFLDFLFGMRKIL
jgi:hypothetical protein